MAGKVGAWPASYSSDLLERKPPSGCDCFHEPSSLPFNATLQTSHAYKTRYGTKVQIMPVAEARSSQNPGLKPHGHIDSINYAIITTAVALISLLRRRQLHKYK